MMIDLVFCDYGGFRYRFERYRFSKASLNVALVYIHHVVCFVDDRPDEHIGNGPIPQPKDPGIGESSAILLVAAQMHVVVGGQDLLVPARSLVQALTNPGS